MGGSGPGAARVWQLVRPTHQSPAQSQSQSQLQWTGHEASTRQAGSGSGSGSYRSACSVEPAPGAGAGAAVHPQSWTTAQQQAAQARGMTLYKVKPYHMAGGYPYSVSTLRDALSVSGDWSRLDSVITRMAQGEPVKVSTFGGSNLLLEPTFARHVFDYLNHSFPHKENSYYNGGVGGTGSQYFGSCWMHHITPGSNLVLVEVAVNDPPERHVATSMENMLRGLLMHPDQPAVILVQLFTGAISTEWYWNGGDFHAIAARYYRVPMISFRDAIFHQYSATINQTRKQQPTNFNLRRLNLPFNHHVNGHAHRVAADLIMAHINPILHVAINRHNTHVKRAIHTLKQASQPTQASPESPSPIPSNPTSGRRFIAELVSASSHLLSSWVSGGQCVDVDVAGGSGSLSGSGSASPAGVCALGAPFEHNATLLLDPSQPSQTWATRWSLWPPCPVWGWGTYHSQSQSQSQSQSHVGNVGSVSSVVGVCRVCCVLLSGSFVGVGWSVRGVTSPDLLSLSASELRSWRSSHPAWWRSRVAWAQISALQLIRESQGTLAPIMLNALTTYELQYNQQHTLYKTNAIWSPILHTDTFPQTTQNHNNTKPTYTTCSTYPQTTSNQQHSHVSSTSPSSHVFVDACDSPFRRCSLLQQSSLLRQWVRMEAGELSTGPGPGPGPAATIDDSFFNEWHEQHEHEHEHEQPHDTTINQQFATLEEHIQQFINIMAHGTPTATATNAWPVGYDPHRHLLTSTHPPAAFSLSSSTPSYRVVPPPIALARLVDSQATTMRGEPVTDSRDTTTCWSTVSNTLHPVPGQHEHWSLFRDPVAITKVVWRSSVVGSSISFDLDVGSQISPDKPQWVIAAITVTKSHKKQSGMMECALQPQQQNNNNQQQQIPPKTYTIDLHWDSPWTHTARHQFDPEKWTQPIRRFTCKVLSSSNDPEHGTTCNLSGIALFISQDPHASVVERDPLRWAQYWEFDV